MCDLQSLTFLFLPALTGFSSADAELPEFQKHRVPKGSQGCFVVYGRESSKGQGCSANIQEVFHAEEFFCQVAERHAMKYYIWKPKEICRSM
jgi:hypothetical protein